MKEKLGLMDMDNTLFDYEGQLLSDLKKLASPEELSKNLLDESIPHFKRRIDLIKNQPGWWKHLPVFKLGWEVYHEAVSIGYSIEILTKGPYKRTLAWKEKIDCIRDHFGDEVSCVIVSKTKSRHYGRFLCDDWPDYLREWLEHRPRGLAIMPAHKYNENFSHPNCIRYDGENLEHVKAALKAAFDRRDKQHWKDLLT